MNKCLICGEMEWKYLFAINDIFNEHYSFGCCLSCSVFSLNPFPDQRQLAQAYDESYYGYGETKFNPTVERVMNWFRFQNAKQFAKNLPSNARVLDVGCGNGGFLQALGKCGNFELHGIEPPGKSCDRAAIVSNLNLHKGYLEKETFSNHYFDAIVLMHVFEHLPNPLESLLIITNISKRGAILQIEIPNINSWQYRVFKSKWLHLDPPRHLNMFPPSVLIKELESHNWKLVKKSYFSPQFSPFGAQQSMLNKWFAKRDVLYEHLKGNSVYAAEHSSFSLFLQKLFQWLSFPPFAGIDWIASLFHKGATVKLLFKKL